MLTFKSSLCPFFRAVMARGDAQAPDNWSWTKFNKIFNLFRFLGGPNTL